MPYAGRARQFPLLIFALLCLAVPRPVVAQPLNADVYKNGERFRAAFQPVAAEARQSTARIYVDGEPVALGIIVSEDGYILTKGSQLRGDVTVRLPDGPKQPAARVGIDGPSDLALLKVDATGLVPAEWTKKEPAVGSWLVSVGLGESPVGIGVVSVAGRKIAPQRGILGITLDISSTVTEVFPGSGADEAGLQVGDVITGIEGDAYPDRDDLLNRLRRFRPGDSLRLSVRRGDKDQKILATLGNESSAMVDRQARQNMMAGPLSIRSGGFDRALQHDTVLRPEDCGGPVADLSGRVVGMNIARAGRVESYALPTSAIQPILARLMPPDNRTAQK